MPPPSRLKTFVIAHVWLLPILLFALWLRLVSIGQEHLYGDEAEYAIVARYLSRDPTFLAYPDITGLGAVPFVSQPPLGLYAMALSMRLLGPTDLAALLPSILFGTATVGVVYAIGHRLGGRLMGLGAAAVLAGLPFHVEMSRRAMLDAGYVLALTTLAYFCVAWLQDHRTIQAVGIGVAVAAAALTKLPGVLAGPIALLVLLVGLLHAFAKRDPERVRGVLRHGAIGLAPVGVGALLYLGLLTYLSAIQNLWVKLVWQFGRVDTSRAQVQEMTAVLREPTWYFTDPKFSMQHELMPVVFAFALAGLIALLVRQAIPGLRRPEDAVIPIFLVVLLSFFMYSDRKEGFYLLPFTPLAAILVGYTADSFRRMLAWAGLRFAPSRAGPVTVGAVALAAAIVAVPFSSASAESVDDFANGGDQERYFGWGTKEAAAFIHERDPEASQEGTLLGRFALHWYNEQNTYHWYVDHTFIENKARSGELRYVVYENYLDLAFDREFMKRLIHENNGVAVQTFREGWGEVTVFELHPS